jgi:hypothetical protein
MVEIPRLQAKLKFVMPVKTGIQVHLPSSSNPPGFRLPPE